MIVLPQPIALYQRFNAALDRLLHAVGPTPTSNENKILVHAP
jgi:hypothetical protein